MKTFSIYQDTEHGLLRVGSFTPRRVGSVRRIAQQFFAKQPNMPREGVYLVNRYRLFGKWADDVAHKMPLVE